jgi:hypothetical protein
MATGAIVARILTQYSDKGSKQAQKDIKKLGASFDSFANKTFKAFGLAAAASAAFAAKIGVDAVQAAIEDQKSQTILANSLKNTIGATNEAIAATEEYIAKQQLLVGVSDTELRQSLITLTGATRNLTEAQGLQNIALDVAASGYGDVNSVSKALAKAYAGNLSALKRLVPGIDASIIKSQDFNKAMEYLSATMGGAAAASADTLEGRLRILKLAYDEVLESLGFALLPVVQEFAGYLLSDVLPRIQAWVDLNKDQLAAGLRDAAGLVKTLLERSLAFGQWVTDNTGKIKILAGVIGTLFVADKIAGFIVALKTITATMAVLRATALGTAVATAFATGGISVAAAAGALAAAGIATVGLAFVKKQMDNANDKTAESTFTLNDNTDIYRRTVGKTTTAVTKYNAANTTTTKKTKELSAEQLKAIEVQKKLNAQFGVTTKENDPVQLEAARLNLVKQQALAIEAVGNAQWKFLEAQLSSNVQAQRYADILAVINDNKISSAEVDALALKWGISKTAVKTYIETVTGIDNIVINKDFGADAAKGWDLAKKALEDYLKQAGANTAFSPATVTAIAETDAATAAALAAAEEAIKVSEGIDAFLKGLNLPATPTIGTPFGQADSRVGNSASSFYGTPFGQASGTTVNVTVNAGSVVGSADALVNTVREGILAGQSSGNVISYNPLNI